MSFNRTMYDPKASVTNFKQTRGPGDYMVFQGAHEVDPSVECSPLSPVKEKPNKNDANLYSVTELKRGKTRGDRTAIESKLQNRNIPLNKSNLQNDIWDKDVKTVLDKPCNFGDMIALAKDNKIKPKGEKSSIYANTRVKYSGCSIYQNSLLTHPKSIYREESTLENVIMPYLHIDKQKAVANDKSSFREGKETMFYRFGTNSRQLTKDTFDMLKYTIPKNSPKLKENFGHHDLTSTEKMLAEKNISGGMMKRIGDYGKIPHEFPYIDAVYREGSYRNGVCDRSCEFGNKNGTFVRGKKACKKYCQHRTYPKKSCMQKGRGSCTKMDSKKMNRAVRAETPSMDASKHPIYHVNRDRKRKPRKC